MKNMKCRYCSQEYKSNGAAYKTHLEKKHKDEVERDAATNASEDDKEHASEDDKEHASEDDKEHASEDDEGHASEDDKEHASEDDNEYVAASTASNKGKQREIGDPGSSKKRITTMSQGTSTKKQCSSFDLLDIDLTELRSEHVNEIILLDSTKVPDGRPTGITYEKLNSENYPNLAESELKENFVPFLVRECAVNQLNAFRRMKNEFDNNRMFDEKGKIFKGPAGAGKSYVLYHVVHFCRASGWLVLYVPTLGSLKDYDNEDVARTILECFLGAEEEKLKDIEFKKNGSSLYDFILDGLDKEKYFETWKGVFSLIRAKKLKYPVLVAVDEWNAKFDGSQCQDLLNYFGLQKLNSGFWLYAISSTFDPIGGFQNADKQTLPVDIPKYSQLELNAILNCQQHFKRLPQSVSCCGLSLSFPYCPVFIFSFSLAGINDREIDYHSGRMPQMIFFWCQAWCGNLQASFRVILNEFNKLAESYYRDRIHKVLKRAEQSSASERKDVFKIAAYVCLNTPVWSLPELWNISGLFVSTQDSDGFAQFTCVCLSVSNAFMKHLSDSKDQIICVLAADPDTKGRAFELLVTLLFHTYSKTIVTLPNNDLAGKLCNPKERHVIVNQVIRQAVSSTNELLRPGTLLILRKGHRVCDLVIYSENNDLYFIQISVQSYMDHDKKAPNLKDELEKTGKPVLKYFMELCQKSDGLPRFPQVNNVNLTKIDSKLPEGVYYVYFSMSSAVVRNTTAAFKHPVILIRREDLGKTMGELWNSYKNDLLASH